jgi:inner membrane protein
VATPIGHGLAGYAVYLSGRQAQLPRATFWLCLLMSIAPDLDFIPGILQGQPNLYHQGVSHSLGAAVAASFAAAILVSGGSFWRQWALLGCAYASHLVLDFLAPDGRPPYGQPLFWPISNEYYFAPPGLQLLWGVHHAKATSAATSEWLTGILQPRNLAAISIEVLVTLPMVLLARYASSLKNRRSYNRLPAKI